MGLPGRRSGAAVVRRSRLSLESLSSALKNRDIRRVVLVWALAIGAEWAHFVALGVFAYDHGGAALVGLAGLVRLLPAGLLSPFASTLADRWRREKMLLALVVVEAAALVGSGAAARAGQRMWVPALAALIGVTSTLVRPAVQSILPSLARTPTELVATNGAVATFEGLGALGGPLIVGATIGLVGAGGVFIAAGVTLAGGAVILSGVHVPSPLEVLGADSGGSNEAKKTRPAGAVRASVAGLEQVARDARARLLIGLVGAQCFVRGCLNVLVVVAAFSLLHAGSAGVGYLNAALGSGGLIGAFAATMMSPRRLAALFGVAVAFWGLPIAFLAPLSWLAPAMLCLVVVGASNAVEDVSLLTLLQRSCPYELLASVLGVLWGLAMTAVALGSIAAPAIEAAVGARTALLLVGLLLPVLALASSRRLSRIDAALTPVEGLDLVAAIPMFAPLSVVVKERLAASLTPVCLAAGETIIQRGEPGDRFYIVKSGRFAVEKGGMRVASAEEGDYFGEVALVQDVPRTASVRAVQDSAVYALGRDSFVAAINGHPTAIAEAQRIATERGAGGPLPGAER
jgi:Cyclic nucleotide-binding domain/Major Facilitator Superfamily